MLTNKANTAPNITNTPRLHLAFSEPLLSFPFPLSLHTISLLPSSIVNETMRDWRMDRFAVLPFSAGCISQSSIAVCKNQPRRAPGQESAAQGKQQQQQLLKNSSFSITAGFQRLIKSLAQHSVEEDEEMEMEIGFPTDVQHVAHIGLDGFNSRRRSRDKAAAAPELFSLPSLSLRQLDLAMAAAPPLPHGPPAGSWPQ